MENLNIENLLGDSHIIPSVHSPELLKLVLTKTSLPCIMLKMGDINTLPKVVKIIHQYGRKVMVHQDSVKGLGKDKTSISFLSSLGADAVITMKPQCVRWIKDEGMFSTLGLFLIDTSAMATGIQSINESKPDAGLVMPMTIPRNIYKELLSKIRVPLLAGGLGMDDDLVSESLENGARAVAVTKAAIWQTTP